MANMFDPNRIKRRGVTGLAPATETLAEAGFYSQQPSGLSGVSEPGFVGRAIGGVRRASEYLDVNRDLIASMLGQAGQALAPDPRSPAAQLGGMVSVFAQQSAYNKTVEGLISGRALSDIPESKALGVGELEKALDYQERREKMAMSKEKQATELDELLRQGKITQEAHDARLDSLGFGRRMEERRVSADEARAGAAVTAAEKATTSEERAEALETRGEQTLAEIKQRGLEAKNLTLSRVPEERKERLEQAVTKFITAHSVQGMPMDEVPVWDLVGTLEAIQSGEVRPEAVSPQVAPTVGPGSSMGDPRVITTEEEVRALAVGTYFSFGGRLYRVTNDPDNPEEIGTVEEEPPISSGRGIPRRELTEEQRRGIIELGQLLNKPIPGRTGRGIGR